MTSASSSTSLTRYAAPRQASQDPWNESMNRDFCNSFWGATDAGVNVLFARMRFAAKTTDELRNYWRERSLIEDEYANKLANLAKMSVGKDEIGYVLSTSDQDRQAQTHLLLASQIRTELEQPATEFFNKQVDHRRNKQAPQTQESYMIKARDKFDGDRRRIELYQQQSATTSGADLERVLQKLERAQQTYYAWYAQGLAEILPTWEEDWKDYCDSCQDLEEDRMDFMKDTLWSYANGISTVCVADDQSCERIRLMLDQLEPEKDLLNFVPEAPKISTGQGSLQINDGQSHFSDYTRTTHRPAPEYVQPPSDAHPSDNRSVASVPTPAPRVPTSVASAPAPPSPDVVTNGVQETRPITPPPPPPQIPLAPPPHVNGTGTPLPDPGLQLPTQAVPPRTPSPPPETGPGNLTIFSIPKPPCSDVLFSVKALYDYTATIDEEFDFQANDVIAVTATPDDGWWSGELLDEARREEGRHIFPSNFVCLF
ncbi:SH3 domain-containing protein [Flagelloscypha sp. PMI_526]|nr:SH3 domain-containing protein [Flagelloscypha sp. PMI_526]